MQVNKKEIMFLTSGGQQEEAFRIFKNLLRREPLLRYPDFEKEFRVTCDASANAIGGHLNQGPIGENQPQE
jgi:hypothetical protein